MPLKVPATLCDKHKRTQASGREKRTPARGQEAKDLSAPVPVDDLLVRLALVRERELIARFLIAVRLVVRLLGSFRFFLLGAGLRDRLAAVPGRRVVLFRFARLFERLVRLLEVVEQRARFLKGMTEAFICVSMDYEITNLVRARRAARRGVRSEPNSPL